MSSNPDPVPAPDSEVAHVDHDDHPEVQSVNTRNATILFLIYLALYAGFMGLASYAPKSMGVKVLAGVNLAIVYGMGLIIVAVLLAMVYMWLCSRTMTAHKANNAVDNGANA
jgi:uncharacterized membrane protein (DUF485 family)